MFVSAPKASFSVVFDNEKITYFNHEALRLLRDERVASLAGARGVDCKSVVGTDKYPPVWHAITLLFPILMCLF